MTVNHVQTDIPGDIYYRAKSVVLNNPKDGIKSVSFAMEKIVNLNNGEYVATEAPTLVFNIDDNQMKNSIALRNPQTNEIVGQAVIGKLFSDVFVALHSLMNYVEEQELTHEN